MEGVSEIPRSSFCVLCCRNSGEYKQKNIFLGMLVKLHDLWDTEFTKNTEITFASDTFKSLTFCEVCEALVGSGIEFKQKLAVVKEEIANYVEFDTFEAEPATKLFRKELQRIIEPNNEKNTREKADDLGAASRTDFAEADEMVHEAMLIPEVEFIECDEPTKSRTKRKPRGKQDISVIKKPSPIIAKSSRTRKKELHPEVVNLEEDSEPLTKRRRSKKELESEAETAIDYSSSVRKNSRTRKLAIRKDELSSEFAGTSTRLKIKRVKKTKGKRIISKTTKIRKPVPSKSTLKSKRPALKRNAEISTDSADDSDSEPEEDEDTQQTAEEGAGMTKKKRKTVTKSRTCKCFLCPEKFCSGVSLKLHLRLSHKQGKEEPDTQFRCPHCQKEFLMSVFEELRAKEECYCEHLGIKTVAAPGEGKCCTKSTFEKFADFHLRKCQGLWYLKPEPDDIKEDCVLCEEKHPLDIEYYLHLRSHYEPEFINDEFCPLCLWKDGRYRAHVTRFHHLSTYSVHRYFCRVCNTMYMPLNPELESGRFVIEEYSHFKSFALEHAQCQKSPKPQQTEFKCKWCSAVFKTPKDLIHHEVTVHTKNLAVSCPSCDRKFVDKDDLRIHAKNHRERRFMCEQCSKVYQSTTALTDHIAIAHVGKRNYMCDECGSSFFTLSKLTVHKYIHTTTKDCACPECGKLFKSNKDVACHVYQVHKIKRKSKPKKLQTQDPPQHTQAPVDELIQSFNFF